MYYALGEMLGCTHHAGGIDCFVLLYSTKGMLREAVGKLGDILGSKDIVSYSLAACNSINGTCL